VSGARHDFARCTATEPLSYDIGVVVSGARNEPARRV
jgi:hypothetical protein